MPNYLEDFERALGNIDELVAFPDRMRTYVIGTVSPLLKSSKIDYLERTKIQNIIKALEGVHNQSLRSSYKIVYNQCCVLGVSALSAALERFFVQYAAQHHEEINQKQLSKIRISLSELSSLSYQPQDHIGRIILNKDNTINFQDLQSTKRSFKDYFNVDITVEATIQKQIIFYQQCRHIIVHKGGIVDEEFISRLLIADANLKNFKLGDEIQLYVHDWTKVKQSFMTLIESVTSVPIE
ncbi:MAG: hypothetical protein Q7S26_02295 [bacterium]|nr:hypothetical protein [bacterium]